MGPGGGGTGWGSGFLGGGTGFLTGGTGFFTISGLRSGAAGEFLDYASAEQAFMAVQMLSFELKDTALQDEIDSLAQSLENDEQYRPLQFARLLRRLSDVE